MISGMRTAGNTKLLAAHDTNNAFVTGNAVIEEGTFSDASGYEHSQAIFRVEDSAVWTAAYCRSNGGKDYFSMTNKLRTDRYLRDNNGSLALTNTLYYNNSYSNKQMWNYGDNAADCLMSEYTVHEGKKNLALHWNGKWVLSNPQMPCYLYQQTAFYTFN